MTGWLTCLIFIEEFIETEMVSQVSTSHILHRHVEVFPVLEGGFHVNDEGITDLFKDGLLIDDWPHAFFQ